MAASSGNIDPFRNPDNRNRDLFRFPDDGQGNQEFRNQQDPFRPLGAPPGSNEFSPDYEISEEFFVPEDVELETIDWVLLIVRSAIILFFLFSFSVVVLNLVRGNRLKNWRLYVFVSFVTLTWIVLALYQDHIDDYYVHTVTKYPQPRSIYWCFRNLAHGLTLFTTVLLLSHLADFQHRGMWLILVIGVILAPLVFSITLLIVDLRVQGEDRNHWGVNIAISTVKMILYNIVTSVLLIVFGTRFCTSRLYGTYEERRSAMVIGVARWTWIFLLLHNLVAIASYGAAVAARIPDNSIETLQAATLVHRILDEVAFLMIVLAIPFSYVVGVFAICCCTACCEGSGVDEADLEMDKVYQENSQVWTTNSDTPRKGRNGNVLNSNAHVSTNPVGGSGSRYAANGNNRGHADNSSITSGMTGSATSLATTVSANSVSRDNAPQLRSQAQEKRRKRESYLEAVSTGSMEQIGGGSRLSRTPNLEPMAERPSSQTSSITTEPVDL